jgi:hypothetical protein
MLKNYKYDNIGYGQVLEVLPEISPYIIFSEKSFRFFIEGISLNPSSLNVNNNFIFNLINNNSKNLSYSIRLLTTWGQINEAYILLRIRLEQLIVCSYLIHEKEEIGLLPFINFFPNIEYNLSKVFKNNDQLKEVLSTLFPELSNKASDRIKEITQLVENSFEFENGELKRKWTKLKVNQLAERRDKLINQKDLISSFLLANYYNTTYKLSSSLVHSDVASISSNFITTNINGILLPQTYYLFINLIQNAHFDIIQCYEISKRMKLNISDKYENLYKEYQLQIKKDLET